MELVRELALFEKAPDEVTVSEHHFEESGFGENPVWWAWVAEVDGVVCGFALYYIRYSTWKGQRLYLEDFYVRPEMRSGGVGTALFQKLIEDGKAKGLNGMVWQALEWNEQALRFYRRFQARLDNEWVNCSLEF